MTQPEAFPIIEVPPEVTRPMDGRVTSVFLIGCVAGLGLDPDTVVFSGRTDGSQLLKRQTFGLRNSIFAVSRTQFLEAHDGLHRPGQRISPLEYLGATESVVAVFNTEHMLGGQDLEPGEPRLPEELQADHRLIKWVTDDGTSLDNVTEAVFWLRGFKYE